MARTSKNPRVVNRTVRAKLSPRRDPYWHLISEGQHLGYRKGAHGGTWIARVYDAAIAQRRFQSLGAADDTIEADGNTVLSFEQAQKRAQEWFEKVNAGDVRKGSYTVADAMADYVADRQREKRKPQDRTKATIEAHILPTLGRIELAKLTHGRVKSWRDGLASASPRVRTMQGSEQAFRDIDPNDEDAMRKRQATANRILTVLKAALNFAKQQRMVAASRAWEDVKPFKAVDLPKVRFLTLDEVNALVAACATDFKRLVQGALLTGCRYGELTALTVADFNKEDGKVYVAQSKNSESRYVDLNEDGIAFFASVCAKRSANERIFVRENGSHWKASEQQRPMDAACEAAKIEGVTMHILRHTYASHAVMNGMPLVVLSEHLGHKDTRITERHYAHLCQTYKARLVRENAPSFGFAGPSKPSGVPAHAARASKGRKGRVVAIAAGRKAS